MTKLDIIFSDAEKVLEKVDFSFLEGKSILVTGATGLLGTHFLAALALLKERGMKIKALAYCHSKPADYTKEIAARGQIELMSYNPGNIDVVIHSAGYAQPAKFTSNPTETIRINVDWTRDLLSILKPGGKFLFVSSSEVYSGLSGTVTESDIGTTNPYHPRSGYIEGKRCGEAIVYAYRQQGVDAKSARLGLTYGPGARPGDKRAMPGFIHQALTEHRIRMDYPGKEPRTICYVRDAVEMMWNVLLHGKEPVYNVGGLTTTNMAEIADKIASILGVGVNRPISGGELPGSGNALMDTNRIEEEFYKHVVSYVELWEGLRNTIDWSRP
jgi:UDP-glucuronate decarboxylase